MHLEDLALDQSIAGVGAEVLLDLLLGLAERERFGLGEEVGEQDVVVIAERVLRLDRREEVARDPARSVAGSEERRTASSLHW